MSENMEDEIAVKLGICMYDNSVEYRVKIIKGDIIYGTGDYEDPEDIREDKNIECYKVCVEDLIKKGTFSAGGSGGHLSIEDAIASVESRVDIKWVL